MAMSAKLLLALLFAVLFSYDVNSEQHLRQNRRQFDYFVLSLHWPRTYCLKPGSGCRNTLPARFTLHGLWPQRFDGTAIPCSSTTISDTVLDKHRTDLLQYWPDLTTTSFERSKPFWRREYREHGSCCTEKFNADEYVERAVRLTRIHDVREYLRLANIRPDNNLYTASRIQEAVQNRTGFIADIQCVTINRRVYLEEVHICINYNGRVVNDCRGRAIRCPSNQNIIFPSTSFIMDQMGEDVELGAEAIGQNNITQAMEWKLENNDKPEDGFSSS